MKFIGTDIPGVHLVQPEPLRDERGYFARTWCAQEFADHGLNPALVQCNVSFTAQRGTLRGMHYQTAPHAEAKLIRVLRGRIHDVLLDLREGTPGFGRWQAFELDSGNATMLYVPEGVAHGFVTLADNTEMFYQMSTGYSGAHAAGVRWNDPAFKIQWPLDNPRLSPRDQQHPLWNQPTDCGDLK
ncbi:dTDP-4-dehydrorhamnose 3,5-epimerase [Cupriavidus agavae]|uniref:dTDP-4-dehydrorhamnose 3,5-epimerase n=1 Tax=Cupriavidus agavae TaxID=1001822 RepID=A0A4Q7RE09_9BURK|nr:dTDP-4-dehydrorhamnose 3,5-epimerase [Cupriavidus agavae]RZT30827.1 dTDP-4-dehydrorhamnose 3,5-epimerase [Cupriavidus agavae]